VYVSWDPHNCFQVFLDRPSRAGREWEGWELEDAGGGWPFDALHGFPTPAVPTLWEVTADGVKVVERVE
jgi:hypothetical protein